MIYYVTDHAGRTHGYQSDRYIVVSDHGIVRVRRQDPGMNRVYVAEFYPPCCWWLADVKELDDKKHHAVQQVKP